MEDFVYIINPQAAARICFGSTLQRDALPMNSRNKSSLMRRLTSQPFDIPFPDSPPPCRCSSTAKSGFGSMASTVPRFQVPEKKKPLKIKITSQQKPVKQCARPFGRSLCDYQITNMMPGPGTYNLRRNRQSVVTYAFGGRTHLIPAVVCEPDRKAAEMCSVCRAKPKGIYWRHFRLGKTMCRYCKIAKQSEIKRSNVRKQIEMDEYQRARLCEGKNCRALIKQLRAESYLMKFHM